MLITYRCIGARKILLSFIWAYYVTVHLVDGGKVAAAYSGYVKPQSNQGNDDFFTYFVKQAHKYPADYSGNRTTESIHWLDAGLFNKSASYYKKHFLGISLATLWSGIELFAIKSTTSVLMCSGTVQNRNKAMERVLKTALHMGYWCRAGMTIFDPKFTAYDAINSVRRKHHVASFTATNRSAAAVKFMDKNILEPPVNTNWQEIRNLVQAIKADLQFVDTSEAPDHLLDWDSTTPVGQFDLGVVQFIIISHTLMSPNSFGIYDSNDDFISAIAHGSAIFGRILGLQDRFNVALNLPIEMYDRFYRNIVIASLKNIDEHIIHVMVVTMEAMYQDFPVPQFLKLKCWLYHSLKSSLEGFKGERILRLMDLEDRICLELLNFSTGSVNTNTIYSHLSELAFNVWLRNSIQRRRIVFP